MNEKYLLWFTELIYEIENGEEIINYDESTIIDLKKIVFGLSQKEIDFKNKNILQLILLIYEGEIPEETNEILKGIFRTSLTTTFKEYRLKVKHSLFLKLILMLGLFFKNNEYRVSKNEFNKYKLLVSYLITNNLIGIQNESFVLNKVNFEKWMKTFNILEFYDSILKIKYSDEYLKIKDFIYKLKVLQGDSNVWVNENRAEFILKYYRNEIEKCDDLGLIHKIKIDKDTYIKLTNELWFSITNEYPKEWQEKAIVVTPDFEVFIPYVYNPLVILHSLIIGKLKNDIKNNDYLLVVDISEGVKNNNSIISFNDFLKTLELITEYVPDIVKNKLYLNDIKEEN